MKTRHTLLTLAFIALSIFNGQAQKSATWISPTTEYGNIYNDGYFRSAMDITKVELKTDETVVYITVKQRSDYPGFAFQFTSDTYLLANGNRYTVTSADGMQLDKFCQTGTNNQADIVFHFKPLPKGTKVFDLIEGDGDRAFQIRGIKPIEERWHQLYPSYWRDDDTGEWALALLDDCVLYNNQFWTYKTKPSKEKSSAKQSFIISNGKEDKQVALGKMSKGKRDIQISDKKIAASMITGRFLPDYPKKDTRTDFVNTGYKTDTATIVGWMKDMPAEFKKNQFFDISVNDFITDDPVNNNASLDSLGRFSIKIPLTNSSEAFCDWNRCFMRTLLEPGKTYFLLYDFKEGRRFFMGDDVRLQNELLKYPLCWSIRRMEESDDLDCYIDKTDSAINARFAYLDSISIEHPTLSDRFLKYSKDNCLFVNASNIGQARFYTPDRYLTKRGKQYAYDRFWTKMPEPYTLHRDLACFITDYTDDIMRGTQTSFQINPIAYLDEVASNEEEKTFANTFMKLYKDTNDKINAITDAKAKEHVIKKTENELKESLERANAMLNTAKGQRVINEKIFPMVLKQELSVLDSVGATPTIKAYHIIKKTLERFEYYHYPLSQSTIDTLAAMTGPTPLFQSVTEKNNYYTALINKDFNNIALKNNKAVEGMKEGEDILQKLIEPYRGKYILLDVWGTWCGPCKQALSHSKEEYERLAKYNIQYLYLANNSPEDTWKTVIKEYDVTGDNVTHYNLPEEQQRAVEAYIGLRSYPTFKLIDPQGRILDVKVDTRELNSLEQLLEQLTGEDGTADN